MCDPTDHTSLYLYFDRHRILLYVGITGQGMGRNLQHNGKAEWWRYVAHQEVKHFRTRTEALRREREIILSRRPPFNRQHNPDFARARQAYLDLIVGPNLSHAIESDASPVDLYKEIGKQLPLVEAPLALLGGEGNGNRLLRTQLEHLPLSQCISESAGRLAYANSKRVGIVLAGFRKGPYSFFILRLGNEFLEFETACAQVKIVTLKKPAQVQVEAIRFEQTPEQRSRNHLRPRLDRTQEASRG